MSPLRSHQGSSHELFGRRHDRPDVNIGAGTVTCNYDGRAKHRTTIEDGRLNRQRHDASSRPSPRGAVGHGGGVVVKRDGPPGGVAVGVPARVIRHVVDVPAPAPPSRKR